MIKMTLIKYTKIIRCITYIRNIRVPIFDDQSLTRAP